MSRSICRRLVYVAEVHTSVVCGRPANALVDGAPACAACLAAYLAPGAIGA